MRKIARTIALLAVLSAGAITLLAQASSPFEGKWVLNVAKSTFSPGPAPKSEVVTITNGNTSVEGVNPSGEPFRWSFSGTPGKAVTIEGMPGTTVETHLSGNVIDHTWSGPQGGTHGHGVISEDGKTMTYSQVGKDDQGRPVHDVYLFEKQ